MSSGGTSAGKRRALPDDVDFKSSPKTPTRDYRSGVRNHVMKTSNQTLLYGYKHYIKAKAQSYDEGVNMAETIARDLTVQAEHGYYGEKPAQDGKPAKEAALFFQFFTMKGLTEIKASAEKHLGTKLAATAGDWHVAPVTFKLQASSDSLTVVGPGFGFFSPQLMSIASAAEISTDSTDASFTFMNVDAEEISWLRKQLTRLSDAVGVTFEWFVHQTISVQACADTPAPRLRRPEPRKQRLSTAQIIGAFSGMGGTPAQLSRDELRLKIDGSYFKKWSNPAWLMPECALSDCREAGQQQYVEHHTHVCAWCEAHALQDYM